MPKQAPDDWHRDWQREEAQLPSGLQHLSLGCDFNRSLVKVRFPP